jgi:hypothetical protein
VLSQFWLAERLSLYLSLFSKLCYIFILTKTFSTIIFRKEISRKERFYFEMKRGICILREWAINYFVGASG